ncbi:hypothetical protein ON010_g10354 [Phytophthora cinnamomi]|nr:hypothetical protein ON010_g10354 [Phytophthora cinnamomi]
MWTYGLWKFGSLDSKALKRSQLAGGIIVRIGANLAFHHSLSQPVKRSLSNIPRWAQVNSHPTVATMHFRALLIAAVGCLAAVQAKVNWINHDQVKPFAQLAPTNASEKAAIKFKPQLHISYGCHPYPAVQADGSVSDGLKWGGKADGKCKGSGWGSQVYSRSAWL